MCHLLVVEKCKVIHFRSAESFSHIIQEILDAHKHNHRALQSVEQIMSTFWATYISIIFWTCRIWLFISSNFFTYLFVLIRTIYMYLDIFVHTGFAYKRLLNKPYENEVTLTGQNPPSKCCQHLKTYQLWKKGSIFKC